MSGRGLDAPLAALGQGPSFKWVTTGPKQTTNLISSLFTAAGLNPGRLINITDLPEEPFSDVCVPKKEVRVHLKEDVGSQ